MCRNRSLLGPQNTVRSGLQSQVQLFYPLPVVVTFSTFSLKSKYGSSFIWYVESIFRSTISNSLSNTGHTVLNSNEEDLTVEQYLEKQFAGIVDVVSLNFIVFVKFLYTTYTGRISKPILHF